MKWNSDLAARDKVHHELKNLRGMILRPKSESILERLKEALECSKTAAYYHENTDDHCQDAVEGRSPFNPVNSARQGKIDE